MPEKRSDIYADATVSDTPRIVWMPKETVVDEHRGANIHQEPDESRTRRYYWDRGGRFETLEKCKTDIDEWIAITERLAT